MKLNKKAMKRIVIAALLTILLFILAYAVYTTYDAYTQLVVEQQQEHLLVISRAVSQNIDLFLSEQLRDVEILVRTPGFIQELQKYYDYGNVEGVKEYILSYMLALHYQGLSRIYLLDRNGQEVFRYNQYPFLEEFDEDMLELEALTRRGQTGMGATFEIVAGNYGVTLVNMVYAGDGDLGAVVSVVDLESMYEQFIMPLDTRDSDYIMIKDEAGTVIMHQNKEMIGFNYRLGIPEDLKSDMRYADMLRMVARQYEYEEGTAIYRAYSKGTAAPVDEITAYTRMNLGGTSWFVSAVMPVEKALQPVNENLERFALLVTVILVILIVGFVTIYVLQKNRQRLKLQTRYLQEINHTLEELHQSREQVRHYQKLQTIGALAGGIAHEFNNLLTPIMGYCEFLKEQMGIRSKYYEDLDEIHKAGARAKEIVEQILPFSRRESDEAAYSSVSLDAVIRDALKMVRMIIPSSIRMDEHIHQTGANVYGSATQLNQVLLNLCTNAYQSMEREGGTLTISNEVIESDQLPEKFGSANGIEAYAKIVITDTGCGMSGEVMEKIFDPFFTTKDVSMGTGLGLSLVQSILTNHSGFIEVKSDIGKGSSFIIYLPVTDTPVAIERPKQVSILVEREPIHLLLVDDEIKVVNYLKKRLKRYGYQVYAYTDAEEALAAFNQSPDKWDLLIVDYTMPKYKGTVLVQRMKKVCPSLPVILITGLVEKDAIQMKQAKLLDQILIKPLEFDELLQSINQLAK
ncbi:ATP-binding protein [Hydrogenoanaerobacterium sp.]|uniref:ATP-binding protein n=1 Tax=Hydrogenoanaerobacterium sp. TaxID=2953763 RepID=UPI0028990C2A|nr:ATP-binding protein [Hydrogenoanaerobacterium sp.]